MMKSRILVIEDDADNLALVCFLLKQAGYEMLQARDGRIGLEMTYQQHPDLILLDMSIPEIDGWKVARQLKDDPITRSICITALTGHILPTDRKKALDAGCDFFLSKPLDVPNFANQVTAILDKYSKTMPA